MLAALCVGLPRLQGDALLGPVLMQTANRCEQRFHLCARRRRKAEAKSSVLLRWHIIVGSAPLPGPRDIAELELGPCFDRLRFGL